jgi:hypothetical protein
MGTVYPGKSWQSTPLIVCGLISAQTEQAVATPDEAQDSLDQVRKDDAQLAEWLRVESIDLGETF